MDRLHSEDPGHLAPEISESACRAVAGFWKTLYKSAGIFCNGAHPLALNKLTPTTKESGRGGLGGRGQSAPPGGIFKGGYAPLKWSFASFSSNKKRKGRQGFGGAA